MKTGIPEVGAGAWGGKRDLGREGRVAEGEK